MYSGDVHLRRQTSLIKRRILFYVLLSPDPVQVAEIQPLPEAAAETVADPAGDGEDPEADGDAGQTQHSLVSAAARKAVERQAFRTS